MGGVCLLVTNNSNKTQSARRWLVTTALSYLGTPYIWGGDDPSGFDCSGFVIECLKSVGLLSEKEDYTADGLYHLFNPPIADRVSKSQIESDNGRVQGNHGLAEPALPGLISGSVPHSAGGAGISHLLGGLQPGVISTPEKGDLLFHLDKNARANHVVICLDGHFQIGASGGGKGDITPSNSWQDNAFVKIRPIGKLGKSRVVIDPFRLVE